MNLGLGQEREQDVGIRVDEAYHIGLCTGRHIPQHDLDLSPVLGTATVIHRDAVPTPGAGARRFHHKPPCGGTSQHILRGIFSVGNHTRR